MCIDVQGYAKGRLNRSPCYLPKFSVYRIAYAIQAGHVQAEEFKAAYHRALRMAKGVKSASLRRKMQADISRQRRKGQQRPYVRRTPVKRQAQRIEPAAE